MSTLVATRYNPVLKVFYGRLSATGKKPKVALTTCMRKFLIMLNAILRHHLPWVPDFAIEVPSPFSAACARRCVSYRRICSHGLISEPIVALHCFVAE
jgi:hypothetical protein